ncbi:cortex morphogenetic protein CmpA [Bacillus licheniformis]
MPNWLKNQMQRAFYEKDHYQIKLLNQCWYFYRKNTADEQCSSEP